MDNIRIFKTAVLVVLLAVISVSSAFEGTWSRKADMPTARFGLSTSVVGGKIYAIGGGQGPYGTYLSTLEVYDPAIDTWTKKANMPIRWAGAATCVVDDKIYVIGGVVESGHDVPLRTVNEYDPVTDRKSNLTAMQ